jgi:hypothetical protein
MPIKLTAKDIAFLAGFSLLVTGVGLLCWTTGLIGDPFGLLPVAGTLAGGLVVFFSGSGRFAAARFFAGWLLVGESMTAFAAIIFGWTLSECWPLLIAPIGLAASLAGWRRYRALKASFFAPTLTFILLSFALAPFSFGAVRLSFREALGVFWPILLVLVGAVLIGAYVYNRVAFGKAGRKRP